MGTLALLFPGQGVHRVGMRLELPHESPAITAWYEQVGEEMQQPVEQICRLGPKRAFENEELAQVAVYAHGVAAWLALRERKISFDLCCGHSLGIYAALVAAGAIQPLDGLRLVRSVARAAVMESSQIPKHAAMAVILGLDRSEVDEILDTFRRQGEAVFPACFNSARQIVLSGTSSGIDAALSEARRRGAFLAEPLSISNPYHSPLMENVQAHLRSVLSSLPISDPACPVLDVREPGLLRTAKEVAGYLATFLVKPQDWEHAIGFALTNGFWTYQETGPGGTLGRMLRWIQRDVRIMPPIGSIERRVEA